jgi:hypothetical protein
MQHALTNTQLYLVMFGPTVVIIAGTAIQLIHWNGMSGKSVVFVNRTKRDIKS